MAGDSTRISYADIANGLGSNCFRTEIPWYLEFYRKGRLLVDEMVTRRGHVGDISDAFRAVQSSAADARTCHC